MKVNSAIFTIFGIFNRQIFFPRNDYFIQIPHAKNVIDNFDNYILFIYNEYQVMK